MGEGQTCAELTAASAKGYRQDANVVFQAQERRALLRMITASGQIAGVRGRL